MNFYKTKTIKGESPEAIKIALVNCVTDHFKPILAIVFSFASQDLNALCKVINDVNIQLFGLNTNGEFTDEETINGFIVMLLLDINKGYFKIYYQTHRTRNRIGVELEL